MEASFLLAEFDKGKTYTSLSIGISIDSGDLQARAASPYELCQAG
jgi:hypothetical protein